MTDAEEFNFDESLGGDDSLHQENEDNDYNTEINTVDDSYTDKGMPEENNSPYNSKSDDEISEKDELEAIKERVLEMEQEAEKLKSMQEAVEQDMQLTPTTPTHVHMTPEQRLDADRRSIYIGNVDYGATASELETHFHGCGSVNRVTILCDHFSGHPKGYGYIEFADKDSIDTSIAMDGSLFRGRQIKVTPKRTNRPGISTTDRPPRGRGGYRGRGGRGGNPYQSSRGGARGRGSYRSRRAHYASPY